MFKTEKFLCFTLETGGLVVGWFVLAINALCCVLSVVGVVALSILTCQDIKTLVEDNEQVFDEDSCFSMKIFIIISLVISALLSFVFAVVGWFCVSGTSTPNHNKIKPMVIVLAVTAILASANVLKFDAPGIVLGLLGGIFYGYLFVCIYSLFFKVREESERGFNPNYEVKSENA